MDSSSNFFTYTQWSIYVTLAFFLLAVLGFTFKWGIRFRLVGVTGFMTVLTVGLFGLSLGFFNPVEIPGAVRFTVVYDNGANQAVISVPVTITESELEATLKQASSDLFSYGRTALNGDDKLTVRARALLHDRPGTTTPLYLGQVRRSLFAREDFNPEITIFSQNLEKLSRADGGESS